MDSCNHFYDQGIGHFYHSSPIKTFLALFLVTPPTSTCSSGWQLMCFVSIVLPFWGCHGNGSSNLWDWFVSLSITCLQFIQVVAFINNLCVFLGGYWILFCCIDVPLFTHLHMSSQFLVSMNRISINTHEHKLRI